MPLKDVAARKKFDRERNRTRRAAGYVAPAIQIAVTRVNTMKSTTPCKDCGRNFPAVCMDFDHLRDKVEEVSRMVADGLAWQIIALEIAKCEIVCANCHRLRTEVRRYNS